MLPQEKPKAGDVYLDENEEPQIVGRPLNPERVSMVRLIANREQYDGKRIVTQGFFVYAYENMGLYLSREDAFNGLSHNGFVFDGSLRSSEPNEDPRTVVYDSHLHYVTVAGTFHKLGRGHLDAYFAGTLSDLIVYRVDAKSRGTPYNSHEACRKEQAPRCRALGFRRADRFDQLGPVVTLAGRRDVRRAV